jgi:hypothetical protein
MKVAQVSMCGALPGSVGWFAHRRKTIIAMTSYQGAAATAEHRTDAKDEIYNVVSVLYHALQVRENTE